MKNRKKKNLFLVTALVLISLVFSVLAEEIEFIDHIESHQADPQTTTQGTGDQSEGTAPQGDDEQEPQPPLSPKSDDYDTAFPIPARDSEYPFKEGEHSYWNTPMDISRPDLIWQAMEQPVMVLQGEEKDQYQLRAEPSKEAQAVGDVTYTSQAVRVIETLDNGWTLVESYSSSFHYSKVKALGTFVRGYVETKLLKEKPAVGDYGIVIDKLTQRMYIIKNGELYTTMIISTGLATDDRPYQETRSGEYLVISPVGAFKSEDGRETYELALRYNAGDLIHKVPYVLRGDTKNFAEGESFLGQRASHGCIRVQRKRTPEGVNQDWLWKNRKMGTRVWIWEDYQGRQIHKPQDDLVIYYNPNGGKNYHSQEKCYGVRDEYLPLTAIEYRHLKEGDFEGLTPCEYCNPPMRPEVIDEVNQKYAITN